MESKVITRIKRLLEEKNLNVSNFAKAVGMPQVTVNNYILGRRKVSFELIERIIQAYPDVSSSWLLTGKGEMYCDNSKVGDGGEAFVEKRPHVPAEAAAGSIGGLSEGVVPDDCVMRPVVAVFPSYDMTISIKGDSMEPKFEGGDIVAIRKVVDYIEWGKTYVVDTADGVIIKRLYDEGESYRCVSFNKEYPDFLVDKRLVYGVYKVVGLLRV